MTAYSVSSPVGDAVAYSADFQFTSTISRGTH